MTTYQVKGFQAAGIHCGIKPNGGKDLSLVVSDQPCTAAGVFTTNRIKAAPVLYDQSILPEHAIIGYDRGAGEWRLTRYNSNVRDLFVNGERVADEARTLRADDVIKIGKHLEFRFEVER